MNQVLLNLLLLVLVICTPSTTATTYYVLADDGDDCPTGNDECHPLSYYTSDPDSYFTNNTVFYFLTGNHSMNESVIIQGKSNITLNGTGISSSIITCNSNGNHGGFAINECDFIVISKLSVHGCKLRELAANCNAESSLMLPAMAICNTWNVHLLHLHLISCINALFIKNCIEMSITNSSFAANAFNALAILYYPPLPLSHTISGPVAISLVDCNIQGGTDAGLYILINNGESYELHVTLDSVNVSNGDGILLYLSNSLYDININKLRSFDNVNGLEVKSKQIATSNVTSHCSLVITDSELYNNFVGVAITLTQAFTNVHAITLHSCRIHHNIGNGLNISKQYQTDNTIIHIKDTVISHNGQNGIINHDEVTFTNVSIYGTTSTGLTLNDSVIHIEGSMAIFNNTGIYGGGIALYGGSLLVLTLNSNLFIYNNIAELRGGGILDRTYACPILTQTISNVFVNISGNTAVIGDDIYGFDARSCVNVHFNPDIQQVSSPVGLYFCNTSTCQSMSIFEQRNAYPGQIIQVNISLFAYDFNGNYVNTDGTVQVGIFRQSVSKYVDGNCSSISYKVVRDELIFIRLTPRYIKSSLTLTITTLQCPTGFALSSDHTCGCSPSIKGVNVTCDITTLQMSRTGPVWIGTNTSTHDVTTNNSQLCLIKEDCFMCNNSNVTFTLDDTEYHQCNDNRSGILCGQCRDNYSLLLGSNRCELCNDNYNLALIIPFAVLGIILVVFLLLFNFTVSQGTLNGIIFYANIVKLYQPVFSAEGAYPFFKQILSWFNLDFGIETCFFDGMDSYSKTWLQYAFPLYLWIIVLTLIIVSKKFSLVARLDLIPVISTLFLLSYTKVFYTVVDGLHLHHITAHCKQNESSVTEYVWYIDPNLPYAQGKHVWLFAFSLIMLFFFCIPYTLFLLFNPVLESHCQNYKCCHFLYKLKPIFDAYNGRVKDNYRFWAGLLLVARLPPLLAIALLDVNQHRLILLALLLIIVTFLLMQNIWLKGVYESKILSVFESWFYLQLIVMSLSVMITLYIDNDPEFWPTASRVLLTICIATFICSFLVILAYHVHLRLAKKTWYIVTIEKISYFLTQKKQMKFTRLESMPVNQPPCTHSSLQFEHRESVLELLESPTDVSYDAINVQH